MNKNKEQLKKLIAQMNVFSQHKKAMEETTRPKKRSSKQKKYDYENDKRI